MGNLIQAYFRQDSNSLLINAKKGDFLHCTKVYSQSKKYTVGMAYEIINIQMMDDLRYFEKQPYIVIRDDKNKLTRINQKEGISFTEFYVVKKC